MQGMMGGELVGKVKGGVRKAARLVEAHGKEVFQYGFIPLIIIIGMQTEPRPTLQQLLSPM